MNVSVEDVEFWFVVFGLLVLPLVVYSWDRFVRFCRRSIN